MSSSRTRALADGTRIVAAGPPDALAAEHGLPPDVADRDDLTVLPGRVDAHVHLDKVIMEPYPGGAQIIAGTDAGIGNCPHDAYASGLEALAMVGLAW